MARRESLSMDTLPPISILWSEEEKKILQEHLTYTEDRMEFLRKCWSEGPTTRDKEPSKPSSDLNTVLLGTKKKGKAKKRIADMTNDEFIQYLHGKIAQPQQLQQLGTNFSTEDDMIKTLNASYQALAQTTNQLLSQHFEFGRVAQIAKRVFQQKRKEWKIKGSWQKWIVDATTLSSSYIRQHIQIYNLVSEYPRLAKLEVTYTEFYKMSKKIEEAFQEDQQAAAAWKA